MQVHGHIRMPPHALLCAREMQEQMRGVRCVGCAAAVHSNSLPPDWPGHGTVGCCQAMERNLHIYLHTDILDYTMQCPVFRCLALCAAPIFQLSRNATELGTDLGWGMLCRPGHDRH